MAGGCGDKAIGERARRGVELDGFQSRELLGLRIVVGNGDDLKVCLGFAGGGGEGKACLFKDDEIGISPPNALLLLTAGTGAAVDKT